ncbi:MAG: hypothetical protein JWM74_4048 [Myxococcaceae bacterium]|nr:hypothetical protein [Myxococcaceae bacterium]
MLHRDSAAAARAKVDEVLGPASDYTNSPLLAFRLSDPSQVDWKEEVGHYLLTAERLGFLAKLSAVMRKQARRPTGGTPVLHANDKRHLALRQQVAPAMAVHYFVGTGWSFVEWEPENKDGDVDYRLCAPTGERVAFQQKASDQPGGRSGGRIVDGEHDDRIIDALGHGARQLPKKSEHPQMLVMSAQRLWLLAGNPQCVIVSMLGSTTGYGSNGHVELLAKDLGLFHSPEWRHVGGIVLLDYVRSIDRFAYACTVLLNPWCDEAVRCDRTWFPHGRVAWLDGDVFRWERGAPQRSTLPEGTVLRPRS